MDFANTRRDDYSQAKTQHYPPLNLSPRIAVQEFSSASSYQKGLSLAKNSSEELVLPPLDSFSKDLDANEQANSPSSLDLQKLLRVLPTGILTLNSKGRVTESNPAAQKLLGSGLEGEYWRDIIEANFDPRVDDGHEVSLISGKRVSLMTRSLDDGSGQLIVITDLTETRDLQTELSRHQRLSAMGRMMSSLAHQIRTPLSAALLHADNLISRLPENQQVANTGQKIVARLNNIERQIKDMLIFAKGGVTATQELHLSEINSALYEAATEMGAVYDREIRWRSLQREAVLNCNLDALVGAFLNVLENGIQASPEGKHLEVSIFSFVDGDRSREFLSIQVADQGTGVESNLMTNKEANYQSTKLNGNGLGLEIVKMVCKSHGGSFQFLESKAGAVAELQLVLSESRGL